jgi:hypothetical protein
LAEFKIREEDGAISFIFLFSQISNESSDEKRILHHLQELSQSILAVQKRLDNLEVKTDSIDLLTSKVTVGFEMAESVLGKIASALGVKDDNVGDDEEDRKRLKVRLKEAIENKRPLIDDSVLEARGFLERYFGICPPNGRIGQHGSRSGRQPDIFLIGNIPTRRRHNFLHEMQAHPPTINVHARSRSGAESTPVSVCEMT